jgi:hypothetical protein
MFPAQVDLVAPQSQITNQVEPHFPLGSFRDKVQLLNLSPTLYFSAAITDDTPYKQDSKFRYQDKTKTEVE